MLNAEKMAYLRSIKGLTLQEVADRIGCTKPYISMLENRKQEYNQEFYEKWLSAIYGTFDIRKTEEYKNKQEEKALKSENKVTNKKR